MRISTEDQAALARPFPNVRLRVGQAYFKKGETPQDGAKCRGRILSYVSAQDVMDRLDEVFGVGGWSSRVRFIPVDAKTVVATKIVVHFPEGDIFQEDTSELGEDRGGDWDSSKEAVSDSLKRAAVKLGVGRYHYRTGPIEGWLIYNGRKRAWEIPEDEYKSLIAKYFPETLKPQEATVKQPVTEMTAEQVIDVVREMKPSTSEKDALYQAYLLSERDRIHNENVVKYGASKAIQIVVKVGQDVGTWDSLDSPGRLDYLKCLKGD